MWDWIRQLDRVLRGEATRVGDLRGKTIDIQVAGLSAMIVMLGMAYGLCMGCYALFNRPIDQALLQLIASTLKVPALFFLTLAVTLPSLYVFNALVGSQLRPTAVWRLLIASLGVNLAVLASFGPIVAFFCLCTTSYSFIKVLNVIVFTVAGGLGLTFLLQTLHRLSISQGFVKSAPERATDTAIGASVDAPESSLPEESTPEVEVGALDQVGEHVLGRHVKAVFGCWVVVFGLVGAQMGWVLRPLIGSPDQPFEWFRARESNFFEAVFQALASLFSSGA